MGNRFRQQRGVRGNFGRSCEIDMARQRADGNNIAAYHDSPQFGDLADIDDQFRRNQTQIHRGHQALAAREHLRLVPVRTEQLQSVHNTGCACIAESRSFHWRDLPRPDFGEFPGIRRR
jgi:hypothetical protein